MAGVEIGQELSHYEIVSRIGAGGMGEVFLAEDKILGRRVALKLLPARFTQNAERLQRFMREARAASALNHPNILTIYEIGAADTAAGKTHFIATEFIEGQTLRTWVADEDTRLRQALKIAVQVASALDAAHKAGIVHRDIKPENVMVRPDGLVKVLDFGLAKLTPQPVSDIDTEARTLIEEVKSMPGMILGTLRYMSPEQARGRPVDARTDVFSLGVVLYELLTKQPLFAGDNDADVVAAVIHKEAPPLGEHLSEVPAELERILQKALAKDRERRYQDARDLQIDLQTLKQESEMSARIISSGAARTGKIAAQTASVMTAPRFSLRQLLLVLPALLLLAGAAWWLASRRGDAVETPPLGSLKNAEVVKWASVPGETYSLGTFSPDSKWIAFVSSKSGTRNIWVRPVGSGEDHQSTKDEFINEYPVWSPTGEEIAFFSLGRGGKPAIWRMPMMGGELTHIMTPPTGEGNLRLLRWSKDGATIYYESRQQLFAVDVQAGEPKQLTDFDTAQVRVRSLSISADEKQIAYFTSEPSGLRSLWVKPARGGQPKRIVETSAESRNTVWHPDGERVFYSSNVDGAYQVFVADVDGRRPAKITSGERDSFVVDVSADGAKVLYGSSEEKSDLWGVNLAKADDDFVVASDIGAELWPDVSPDNKQVAYQAIRNPSQGNRIYTGAVLSKPIDVKAAPFVLSKEGAFPRWSPDGRQIAFVRREKDSYTLKSVNAGGGEERALVTGGLLVNPYSILPYARVEVGEFGWSPDSSKLAYCSVKDGLQNLRVISADGSGETQISNNTDANLLIYCPVWSPDARQIAFTTRPNKISSPKENINSFWVADLDTKLARPLVQLNQDIHLLGWSQSEHDLLFVRNLPVGITLWRVSTVTGRQSLIAEIPSGQYYITQLSPDGRLIAYVSRQEGKDNIWVIPTSGGAQRKLTANNDPQLYFSTLAWSPDSRTIYYSKQSRFSLLSMITNFE